MGTEWGGIPPMKPGELAFWALVAFGLMAYVLWVR